MKMNFEDVCFVILLIQESIVLFLEYGVYRIHKERFKERAKWREQKRQQQLKKNDSGTKDSKITTDGALSAAIDSPNIKAKNAPYADDLKTPNIP